MGTQCCIILSWYTETGNEREQILRLLDYPRLDAETKIEPLGNRAFDPEELQCEIFSFKDWGEEECLDFFVKLQKKVKWQFRATVQVYYTPAMWEGYAQFKYFRLFSDTTSIYFEMIE